MNDASRRARTSPAPSRGGPLTSARRILVSRPDNLGDVLMLGPALRELRSAVPGARITLLASPAGRRAAALLPWIDEVWVERVVWQDASGAVPFDGARERRFIDTLAAHRFDAALIFTSFSQTPWVTAYACYLAGIPLRAGESKEFGGSVLSHAVPPSPDGVHQVDRNARLVEHLGVRVERRDMEVSLPPTTRVAAEGMLRSIGIGDRPYAVVAPGASCAARRYERTRFAEVVGALRRAGLGVAVVGGPRERDLAAEVAGDSGAIALAGRTTVPVLAALIERAAVAITNNSGPLHLADALRTPVVVLYSGTDLRSQWEPRVSPARILDRSVHCSPCYGFDCPTNTECLDVPAGEVVDAALEIARTSESDRTPDRRRDDVVVGPVAAAPAGV